MKFKFLISAWHIVSIALICITIAVVSHYSAPDRVPPHEVEVTYQSDVHEVTLSWTPSDDSSGIRGYYVYRNGKEAGFTKSTEFIDKNLKEFTSYAYMVESLDSAGNTCINSINTKTADEAPPTEPTGLSYASTAESIHLTWTPSEDTGEMYGYELYRDEQYIGFTTAETYTFDGLQEYTNYMLTVSAVDKSGKKTPAHMSAQTSDVTPPPKPENLVSQTTADSVVLTWTSSADSGIGTGLYKVYRNKTFIGTTETPAYTDTGLESNADYTYTVEAYDKNNNGPSSAEVAVKTYDDRIQVLSFNILNYSGLSDPNSRENVRAPKIKEYLTQYHADVIGYQEINKMWLQKITSWFPEYTVIGGYNENHGYDCPIFYLTDKYDVVDSGTKRLGQTRTCTWAVLRDKVTGKSFAVFNTHLDYQYTEYRKKETLALLEKVDEIKKNFDVPMVCTGDFNEDKSVVGGVYDTITAGILKDSSTLTETVVNKGITFHDWITVDASAKLEGHPIDYCFVHRFDVLSYKVTRDSYPLANNSQIYPSDHFGLFVKLKPQ